MKRADGTGNGIDAALNARDDPNYARTVYDAYNDREVTFLFKGVGLQEMFVRFLAGASVASRARCSAYLGGFPVRDLPQRFSILFSYFVFFFFPYPKPCIASAGGGA